MKIGPHLMALFLAGSIFAGCGTIPSAHPATIPHRKQNIPIQTIQAALSHAAPSGTISHVHIISEKAISGQRYAYLSYNNQDTLEYAGLLESPSGVDTMTFSLKKPHTTPLQAVELNDQTYILVVGKVTNHPDIMTIVLTFANGQVADVPVSHGYFWYFHRVGKSKGPRFFTHLIGVSTTGAIIQNAHS
ncbi:hypothetical protein [Sulfobacillus thermosulfidooxidans]|uniref:hypothetical protein n=1 Tax=Sulfobacillus thermosulfidooxidans TaxID=28034 RepID=UPI0006B479F0|nr:hypothetical protein [Sulfobacillus thermosulfidooxidans]